MDLHSGQCVGYFDIPVDHVYGDSGAAVRLRYSYGGTAAVAAVEVQPPRRRSAVKLACHLFAPLVCATCLRCHLCHLLTICPPSPSPPPPPTHPPTHLSSPRAVILDYLSSKRISTGDLVVVSPDVGGVARARAFAKKLNDAPLAIVDKRRSAHNVSEVMNLIGDVRGKVRGVGSGGAVRGCAVRAVSMRGGRCGGGVGEAAAVATPHTALLLTSTCTPALTSHPPAFLRPPAPCPCAPVPRRATGGGAGG